MLSLSAYLDIEVAAAAVLAAWLMRRHPTVGPRSVVRSALLLVATVLVGDLLPAGVRIVVRLPAGFYLALLAVVLPSLFAIFLATGWFLRALFSSAGGSQGGGHPAFTDRGP